MTPERRRQVEELYHVARALAPNERASLLAETDPDLRRAVEDRLATVSRFDLASPAPVSPNDQTSTSPAASHHPGALQPGAEIGSYRIVALLGAGGMGEVYRARDRKLERDVAIKALPRLGDDRALLNRLQQEARALAALNHPNIAVIHDLEEWEGGSFLVLELVEGETLDVRLQRKSALPLIEALTIGMQVADALGAAHARGITHRDIKPSNIKLTPNDVVKVLDFGLAKSDPAAAGQDAAQFSTRSATGMGVLLGTPPYISPEQVHGRPADHRSDLWALGCVLYELLTGTRAFRGETTTGTLAAIVERDPNWAALPAGTPQAVRNLLGRLLQKEPERRYQSAAELKDALADCRSRLIAPGPWGHLRKPKVAVPAFVALLAIVAGVSWFVRESQRQAWAREVALPEIVRLVEEDNSDAAFRLGRQAERYIPDDPQLLEAKRHYATHIAIESTPPGADVYVKGYLNTKDDWLHVGRTPMAGARVPSGYLRWRLTKDGFPPTERAAYSIGSLQFRLSAATETPPGMVHVPGGPFAFRGFPRATLEDFSLAAYEVTNRQFKEFIDAGGYAKREYWTEPFVNDNAGVPWEEAMVVFRDSTGRPGPSTWSLGTYPDGQAEFPVGGVSWYEAAAYAKFAGVRLPTIHHWLRAHATPQASQILQVSNFSGEGPARVGSHAGLSPFGNYDMAGNVREWCWNASSPDRGAARFILGASWREPAYRFPGPDLADPWDRSSHNGFRTARYDPSRAVALEAPVERVPVDFARMQPVADDVFDTYRRFYSYERTDLNPLVEDVDDTALHWRQERLTFNAAYGNERIIAYLFLPKNAEPPYQTIVYFASGIARQSRSREEMGSELRFVDFLPRIGRAVLFLVYKGTYERHIGRPVTVQNWTRDLIISWSRDFSRSIDYLETRKDIDLDNLGYFSFSNPFMPVFSAIDGRIKAGAHIGAGFPASLPAEIHPINFAPRATEPTLLIAGRYDFIGPVETTQRPLLRLLGAPAEHKRLALFETGHVVYPGPGMIKEVLDWFDRFLGPVRLKTRSSDRE
jgi:formylglycine-generating enzyme required for sulfatase activity/tRNA A-37 threonylcarbamoyl transferase component Bud32